MFFKIKDNFIVFEVEYLIKKVEFNNKKDAIKKDNIINVFADFTAKFRFNGFCGAFL
jgi:hypothetical protein